MSDAPIIDTLRKGWCPGVLTPMESGDGLLVRIKPPAGIVAAEAAHKIAAAASRCGNGQIDLTNRANLQFRGLNTETVEAFAGVAIGCGLAADDAAIERRRNVSVDPLAAADPAGQDSHGLARLLEAALAAETRLAALPDKFGFRLDGGAVLPLGDLRADIGFRMTAAGAVVTLDGAAITAYCAIDEIVAVALRLALVFVERTQSAALHRMRDLVANIGAAAIFAAAGLNARAAVAASVVSPDVGYIAYPDQPTGVFLAGLAFGRIDAATLARIADLARSHADGNLRMTPWRMLALAGVRAERAAELEATLDELGLIVAPDDRLLRVAACVGKPSCASAFVDTRAAARRLAAFAGAGLHISGCSKGCAHPGAIAVTLVGAADGYALVRRGRASDTPLRRGLSLDQIVAQLQAARA